MKKYLPTTNYEPRTNNSYGFTLIELLIVIAIIAILAIIAFAAFAGLLRRGNDTRRAADIKGIADALEVKRGNDGFYKSITADDFGTGKFPKEPTSRPEKYCYIDGASPISNPSVWSGSACPTASWDDLNDNSGITITGTPAYFKVCTVNTPRSDVICYGSRQ